MENNITDPLQQLDEVLKSLEWSNKYPLEKVIMDGQITKRVVEDPYNFRSVRDISDYLLLKPGISGKIPPQDLMLAIEYLQDEKYIEHGIKEQQAIVGSSDEKIPVDAYKISLKGKMILRMEGGFSGRLANQNKEKTDREQYLTHEKQQNDRLESMQRRNLTLTIVVAVTAGIVCIATVCQAFFDYQQMDIAKSQIELQMKEKSDLKLLSPIIESLKKQELKIKQLDNRTYPQPTVTVKNYIQVKK